MKKHQLIILFILIILLVACQDSAKEALPTATLPLITPTMPGGELSQAMLVDHPEEIVGVYTGFYYARFGWLSLSPEGNWSVAPDPDGTGGISGTYAFQDGIFLFSNEIEGEGCEQPGRYQAFVEKSGESVVLLSLRIVEDACFARKELLVNGQPGPWKVSE